MNRIINKISAMWRRGALLLVAAVAAAGCERDSDLDLPLAVNTNDIRLEASGGSTNIMIYSDGDWSVSLSDEIDWGGLDVLRGTGNSKVKFSYSENLEAARRVDLLIENSHGNETVQIIQKGVAAKLAFLAPDYTYPRNKATVLLPLSTNLRDQLTRAALTIEEIAIEGDDEESRPAEWLEKSDLTPEGLLLDMASNGNDKQRSARIVLRFVDGLGTETVTNTVLSQTDEYPSLKFVNEKLTIGRPAATVTMRVDGNAMHMLELCTAEATYPEGTEPWVGEIYAEEGVLMCEVGENTTSLDREATITLAIPDADPEAAPVTLKIVQTYNDPTLEFLYKDMLLRIGTQAAEVALPLSGTALATASSATAEVTYPEGTAQWITSAAAKGEAIVCNVAANTSGKERRATVTMNYVISEGWELSSSLTLVQAGEDPTLLFEKEEVVIGRQATTLNLALTGSVMAALQQCEAEVLFAEGVTAWASAEIKGSAVESAIEENESGETREATVRVNYPVSEIWTVSAEIKVKQLGEYPSLKFKDDGKEVGAGQTDRLVVLAVTGNGLGTTEQCECTADQSWVTGFEMLSESVRCSIEENNTGKERRATVTMTFRPEGAPEVVSTVTLVQDSDGDFRALIQGETGTLELPDGLTLQGVVISNAGNVNMEYNYATPTTVSADRNISLKTAYMQRVDGSYGFRLQFADKGDNTLKRYSKVTLSLDGTTLVKEENPTRYTITGLTADNITSAEEGTADNIVKKERTIAQLTDNDVYTWVSIPNAQIGINDGSYTNINEGYKNYFDCIPLTFFDHNGGSIRMLTNSAATWRRSASGTADNAAIKAPDGSGTLSGIVVHTKILRAGGGDGTIGRYQIRVIDEKDIALEDTPKSTDARTLVEWNWNDKKADMTADKTLAPEIGEGKLYGTISAAVTHANGPYTLGAALNGLTANANNMAGNIICDDGCSWWDFSKSSGEAIVAKFSTKGINASHIMLIMDVQGGSGSSTGNNRFPTYWHIEYSLDGVNWTKASNDVITVRPLIQYNKQSQMPLAAPYYNDYAISLPSVILGQESVYVAMRASSAVCEHGVAGSFYNATNLLKSSDSGFGNIRFNTFSIRYF